MSEYELDAATLVRDIIEEARRTIGSGPLFAQQLEALGVGPDSGAYSQSAVSNWIKGRTMPPGDVVLAAARLAGISLDERLLPAIEETADTDWHLAIDELQNQIDVLHAQIIEVCGRVGVPVPVIEARDLPDAPRAASG